MLLLLVAQALAKDTVRIDGSAGVWLGASTGDVATSGGVGWERDARFVEVRHADLESLCFTAGCDMTYTTRTLVVAGYRWTWSHGSWMVAADVAAGAGGGPNVAFGADQDIALGVAGQARLSAGLSWVGVQALALEMAGAYGADTEVSMGLYVNVPLR